MANTFDTEMSQLEGARKIYVAQGGAGGATSGGAGTAEASAAAADITKKDLLRASDVRLNALKQDLVTYCARASSTGFNHDRVSELLHFVDHFGANRLRYDKLRTRCLLASGLISAGEKGIYGGN